jgi:hypothetical protein
MNNWESDVPPITAPNLGIQSDLTLLFPVKPLVRRNLYGAHGPISAARPRAHLGFRIGTPTRQNFVRPGCGKSRCRCGLRCSISGDRSRGAQLSEELSGTMQRGARTYPSWARAVFTCHNFSKTCLAFQYGSLALAYMKSSCNSAAPQTSIAWIGHKSNATKAWSHYSHAEVRVPHAHLLTQFACISGRMRALIGNLDGLK